MTERAEQREERAALAPREAREMPYLRAIPRPTPWPIITAFGVTFMFAAIVTNIFVVVVGAVVEDKTGQDKTSQDKTRQDRSRQDKIGQGKTMQDKTL